MQFFVIALALVGFVAADVSHLLLDQNAGYSYSASSSSSSALPGGDSSSYQPEDLIPQHLKASHVETASAEIVPGGDSSSYQPAHLIPQQLQSEVASAEVIPGGDSSSYQPAHLIPQQLQTETEIIPGGDSSSYQPAHLIPQQLQSEVASAEVIPGGDSSSYQPAHLIPQQLQTETEIIPGGDSSSYQPAQVIEQQSFNLGADTQTPEQFIPEADRVAHAQYVQEQEQQQQAQVVVPGGDSSSYQPAHLIPQQLQTETEVIPGGDSSSYQPADLIPQHLKASHGTYNIGADTQTPEQFIPEADRVAHYAYTQSQTLTQSQPAVPSQELQAAQVETASYNLGADTQTPEQFIPEADRIAHAKYVEQEQSQSPVVYQEPVSNGIEEFNAETHVPVVIGADTITPAHLLPKYSAGASSSSSSSSASSADTQYGSNGGYIY
ncbi:uncharacterized protein LOC133847200 [Drosophila sulfurigaster albostrigata]|uniref:uncharacterized protein LOC133847200 n=1 Tax=Drosophila sulfurigaster albostrigata TaxID=89887 RepID=UPI002D21C1C8|nr:uncharacterized protein LOC133847200 [Drosophila sulfurigaster albostrigata]